MNINREKTLEVLNKYFNKKQSEKIEKQLYDYYNSMNYSSDIKENIYYNRLFIVCKNNKKVNVNNIMDYTKYDRKWNKLQDDLDLMNREIMIKNDAVCTGMFFCNTCKKDTKCTYYSLQTRSADEPMTNFITCLTCNKNWKE